MKLYDLKLARDRAGLTQEDIAESLGVSRQAVSMWETGKKSPSSRNLKKLADLLNVSVDSLLRGDELMSAPSEDKKNAPAGRPGEGVKSKISDSIFDKNANREYFIPMYKYSTLRLHGDGDFQSVDYELVPFPCADLSPDPARPPYMLEQDVSFGLAGRGVAADDRAVIVDPSRTQVESGRFYLVSLNGELMLRQLYRSPAGGVIVEGDNAFHVEVPANSPSLRILGRAVMSVRGL